MTLALGSSTPADSTLATDAADNVKIMAKFEDLFSKRGWSRVGCLGLGEGPRARCGWMRLRGGVRSRRKTKPKVKKIIKPSKYFDCPKCDEEKSVSVHISRAKGWAQAFCTYCSGTYQKENVERDDNSCTIWCDWNESLRKREEMEERRNKGEINEYEDLDEDDDDNSEAGMTRSKMQIQNLQTLMESMHRYRVVGSSGLAFRTKPNLSSSCRADRITKPKPGVTYLPSNTTVLGVEKETGWIQCMEHSNYWLPIHIFNRTQLVQCAEKEGEETADLRLNTNADGTFLERIDADNLEASRGFDPSKPFRLEDFIEEAHESEEQGDSV
eukprot:CAMPEP_0184495052 /NCGR_PEP_ID=MMETSP0113_2-20130426/30261_1 /TAXON_ID=91329 /ORGANISM="Norrisiella sphaerica, Strain BC52" /LENGTH=326 /DNA_ID=CAMNT_0026881077 /DNA_START=46 /DNA_END=1026 /DNA_ORIENTATION=+